MYVPVYNDTQKAYYNHTLSVYAQNLTIAHAWIDVLIFPLHYAPPYPLEAGLRKRI